MRSRQLVIGLGLLFAVAAPLRASAQTAAPSPYPAACAGVSVSAAKSEEAHAFYNAGRALYDEGNYDGAITQFREAYRRDCSKHDLLVIISRSHELKGDRAEAVRALELFLDRVKDSPDAATHRTKIDNLKKQIAAQPPPPPPPPPVTAPPPEVREHTVPPWIVVGVGGAAVAVGIVLLATSPTLPSECNPSTKKCPAAAGSDVQSRAELSQNQPVTGGIVLAGGGVLVLGGLLWHFLEPTGPVAKGALKPSLTPSVSPGYAGLSLGASF
ncbi:MAG TPA: tetratricopeptide repeat protein [Labilithrix sp.]|nr:tetratricopeptide repeat protein [Labilithrix sp.]